MKKTIGVAVFLMTSVFVMASEIVDPEPYDEDPLVEYYYLTFDFPYHEGLSHYGPSTLRFEITCLSELCTDFQVIEPLMTDAEKDYHDSQTRIYNDIRSEPRFMSYRLDAGRCARPRLIDEMRNGQSIFFRGKDAIATRRELDGFYYHSDGTRRLSGRRCTIVMEGEFMLTVHHVPPIDRFYFKDPDKFFSPPLDFSELNKYVHYVSPFQKILQSLRSRSNDK